MAILRDNVTGWAKIPTTSTVIISDPKGVQKILSNKHYRNIGTFVIIGNTVTRFPKHVPQRVGRVLFYLMNGYKLCGVLDRSTGCKIPHLMYKDLRLADRGGWIKISPIDSSVTLTPLGREACVPGWKTVTVDMSPTGVLHYADQHIT